MRRRSLFTLGMYSSLATLALGAGLTACEDGPNQTFSPAAASAGNYWNNGNPDAAAGNAPGSYDATPSTNITPLDLCAPNLQRERWAEMLTQPIYPGNPYPAAKPTFDALGFPQFDQTKWGLGTGQTMFAGLQINGVNWGGLTIEDAQAGLVNPPSAALCSSIPGGSGSDGSTPVVTGCFGDNCEVAFSYVPATHVVGQVFLSQGYTGYADFYSDPASVLDPPTSSATVGPSGKRQNHYNIQIGRQIYKNGSPFEVDWTDPKLTALMQIYNAQMYFYGSLQGVYYGKDNPQPCSADNSCLIYPPVAAPSNGGLCIFGIRPILSYWQFNCQTTLQPGVSTINSFYYDFNHVLPYSHLAQNLAIDPIGPTTHPRSGINTDPPNCDQYMGLDFGSFLKNCGHVDTQSNMEIPIKASFSDLYFAKIVGARTHNVQSVFFNNVGINMSWDDEQPNIVGPGAQGFVTDNYLPCTGDPSNPTPGETCTGPDLATDWEFDVRTDALPDNDNPPIQGATNNRGTGLMQREWATLVQADMNAILQANPVPGVSPSLYTHQLGDPACFVPPQAAQKAGCTGFEGFGISGSPEPSDGCTGTALVNLGNGADAWSYSGPGICANFNAGGYASFQYGGYGSSALSPGDPSSYFCQDPTQAWADTGNCVDGPVWTNALQIVTNVAGGGNPNVMPWELKDRRYFFRWWGIAMIKYYMAYGANQTPFGTAGALAFSDVHNQNLDLTSLFFDSDFLSYDQDEYIIRGPGSLWTPGGVVAQPSANPSSEGPMQQSTPITVPNTAASPGGGSIAAVVGAGGGSKGVLLGPAALPMDYTYLSDTIGANQRYTNWYKRMDREEAAMFRALLIDKSDLFGAENDVNITNLAGNPLLAANYASYECATQWPLVTIPALGITQQPWSTVCAYACPIVPQIPGNCPYPPGVGLSENGTLQGDQNGLPGTNSAVAITDPASGVSILPQPAVPALAGGLVPPLPRLGAYPAVWGGSGAFCAGSGDSATPGGEGDAYDSVTNPFQGTECGSTASMTASPHGSVFQVMNPPYDPNNARLQFLNSDGTPQTGSPFGNPETLQAFVNIPNMINPFNNNTHVGAKDSGGVAWAPCTAFPCSSGNGSAPLTGAGNSINVSVPWTPSQENIGFPIPISGTTSKFVQTAQLDFTGVLETYIVDFVPWQYVAGDTTKAYNPAGTEFDGTIKIEAIEGDDFLGEVFLCQDLGGNGGTVDFIGTQDLLGVHMYDTGGQVLEWLTQHPGLQDSCNVIVQYSEYNNYLNYIASLTAGVAVGIAQGAGYGRVDAVWVFDPSIAQIP
jgi:hypothetical protein